MNESIAEIRERADWKPYYFIGNDGGSLITSMCPPELANAGEIATDAIYRMILGESDHE